MKNSSIKILIVFYYFVVISFLFPRGFIEFSNMYKNIYTILVWSSTFLMVIDLLKTIKKDVVNFEHYSMILYFLFIAVVTFVNNGTHTSGLQRIVCHPILLFFLIKHFRNNFKTLLNVFCNVLMIELILHILLNFIYFNSTGHIVFLGHVQVISQYGVLSIFMSILYWLLYQEHKKRMIIMSFLSLLILLFTDAAIANITFVLVIVFYIAYRLKLFHILNMNSKIYLYCGYILLILLLALSIYSNISHNNLYILLNFNGRAFIWNEAYKAFLLKPIFGYGIEGIKLKVFWNKWIAIEGFNYAHNQLLQNLLDGGLIGFFLFFRILLSGSVHINGIKEKRYNILFNSCLLIFLLIMASESVTYYCYFYIFLAVVLSFPSIKNKFRKER